MVTDPSMPPPGPVELSAGPLSLTYENGYVRNVRLGGHEIVRRIYMALRDEHWNTIPGELSDFSLERDGTAFSMSFTSRHRRNNIDFLWHADVRGLASGELCFAMRGTALSGFRRNRIGLCVLHPLSACKGRPCRVETAGGTVITTAFPETVSPHLIFENVRMLTCPADGGPGVEVRFEGDVFETEDQRNWIDASYKTYSTPLSLPIPVFVEQGAAVNQKIVIVPGNPPLVGPTATCSPLRLAFRSAPPDLRTLPSIGWTAPAQTGGAPFNPPALQHLRVDLRFGAGDIGTGIDRARHLHLEYRVPIEVALHFAGDCTEESASLALLLADRPFTIARFLVYHDLERSTSGSTIAAVRDTLRRCCPAVPVVSGTDGYFVEINRMRPPVDLLDGVCWSANPQVHTVDDAAIMENLPGLLETILAAQGLAGGKKIVLSPLTLAPRKIPEHPEKDGGPDGRNNALFGAAWLLGAIACCIEGKVSSVTLGEINGTSPAAVLLSWLPGQPRGRNNVPAMQGVSSDASRVCGFELRDSGRSMSFAANLTNTPAAVLFTGLPEDCRYSILDKDSFGKIAVLPDPADGLAVEKACLTDGAVLVTLPPYAIVRFLE